MEQISTVTRHLTQALVLRLDADLGAAVARVEDGEAARAAASLAFTVSLDDEERVVVEYVHKAGGVQKGRLSPGSRFQPRLELAEEAAR